MIFYFRGRLSGGNAPHGAVQMNFGGGGAGTDPIPGTDDVGLGGPDLSIETGVVAGTGLSPTSGLTKRTV